MRFNYSKYFNLFEGFVMLHTKVYNLIKVSKILSLGNQRETNFAQTGTREGVQK